MKKKKIEYPYPHKHIPIAGGHITVDENCSQEIIDDLKKVFGNLDEEKLKKWIDAINKHNKL